MRTCVPVNLTHLCQHLHRGRKMGDKCGKADILPVRCLCEGVCRGSVATTSIIRESQFLSPRGGR